MSIPRLSSRLSSTALVLAAILALLAATLPAQTLTTLYNFSGLRIDGFSPNGSLLFDTQGNLYGTTEGFGNSGCHKQDLACGTIFKIAPGGTETTLFAFATGSNAYPMAGVIEDAQGNFYGTTFGTGGPTSLDGTVFRLKKQKTLNKLHVFRGSRAQPGDGAFPTAGVVMDTQGNIYGTTIQGGSGFGTVFEVSASGAESIRYKFTGPDGANPFGGLILDTQGNLYGTTTDGGTNGDGAIFKLTPSGTETVLHSFAGTDGQFPLAGVIRDAGGNFYGTTEGGGMFGEGTVYKLDTSGKETVLHDFSGSPDGNFPDGALIMDAQGNLYGTTADGGNIATNCSAGCGTIFKVDSSGKETLLYEFCSKANCVDGYRPTGALAFDAQGNLYGSTVYGGTGQCRIGSTITGCGTIFKLTP